MPRRPNVATLLLGLLWLVSACRSSDTPTTLPAAGGSAAQGGVAAASGSSSGGASSGGAAGTAGSSSGGTPSVPSPTALAVGPFSACSVGADHLVKCAGRCGPAGKGGSRDQAPAGVQAVKVAVGREFACALLAAPQAGSLLQCWGAGPAAEAPMVADAVELVAGDEHACARGSQGAVTCWGDAAHAAPAGVVAKQLAASGAMTCAISADDSVKISSTSATARWAQTVSVTATIS